jgi:hypothetical protein
MAPAGVITNCNQCHVGNNYTFTSTNTACYPCHTTDWTSTQTLGGAVPNHITSGFPQTCDTCHDMIAWADSTFNHNNTGFPLTGLHASAVQCAQCHTAAAGGYNLPAPTGCGDANCHQADYSGTNNPVHSAAGTTFAATNCANCHSVAAAFTTTSWNHSSTSWPLTGNHQMTPAGAATNCNQCHVGNNYNLTSTACYPCHTTDWTNTQTLGGAVPNHITSGFPQTCDTCHDTILWSDATFNHNNTGFPLTGMHTSVQCAQCHSTAAGGYTLGAPSGCADAYCHQSDYSGTNNPVHSSAGTTFAASNCTNCHSVAAAFTTTSWSHTSTGWALSGNHQMAPAGVITNCNQCHVGNNYTFTSTNTACYPCHTTDWTSTQTLGGNVPNHITSGFPQTCDTCHDMIAWADSTFNHNNTGFPLTGLHTSVQCAQCHTAAAGGYNLPAPTGCGDANCHQTDYSGTNNPVHSAAGTTFAATNCANCHSVAAAFTTTSWNHSSTSWPLTGNHQMTPAGAATNCNQCHVGNNYNLTSTACYPCHTTDWTSTQTLGGNVPNHITSGFPQTCDTCHDTIAWADSTFNHNNTGFPLTGLHTSVQCAQCHSTAAGGYTLGAPSGCADAYCHQSDYSGTNNPVHSSAGTTFAATNCTNCHSTAAAFTTTSWSHNSTNWALTGNHQMSPAGVVTNCNQCHTSNNYGLTTGDCWSSGCHTSDWNSTQTLGGTVPNHVSANFPTSMCASCHDTVNWADGKFDHSTTGWALTGGHIVPTAGGVQACTDCHVSNNYSLTAANTVCYGCHLAEWNSTQTLGGSVPNHITAGYPTTCDTCHTTTTWLGATFNHTWFTLPHNGAVCADCHQVSTDYSQFTCINCHTTTAHQQTQTNSQHGGVSGYSYGPTTCYNCHHR